MRKENKVIVIALALILIAAAVYLNPQLQSKVISQPSGNGGGSASAPATSTPITYSNLASVLSRNSMIQEMPSNAIMLLKFYNFNSGVRQWEKSYIITRGSVKEGTADADLIILLHSKYLTELNENNLCNVIQEAKANGDFGTEMQISTASFMWRYRSMMGYKSCFGL